MEQIVVRVDEQGALKNQRFAFSNRYTLVSELMQNARRAGATFVEVEYDPVQQRLRVSDDGGGIEDFQKLLTFNASGWDSQTQASEHPFGVGFSKCLYSAARCVVTSNAKRIDFDTAAALKQTPIEVQSVQRQAGTEVELFGVELPDLDNVMQHFARGFPIDVRYNGQSLGRRFALGARAFVKTAVGDVYVAGLEDGDSTAETLVFLLGFCVNAPRFWHLEKAVNVVHLDPRLFMARLPDRDKLIDENEQLKRVDAEIKQLWRERLAVCKQSLSAAQFVDAYFETARRFLLEEVFDDVPLLPKSLVERIVGLPIQEGYDTPDYVEDVKTHVARSDVENGRVILVDLHDPDGENLALWTLAQKLGWLRLNDRLGQGHWVHAHVREIDAKAVEVTMLGEKQWAAFQGRCLSVQVVLCEAYALSYETERVVVTDQALWNAEALYVPAGEASGRAVRQIDAYIDGNEHFLEADLYADREALEKLLHRLRSVDAKDTLKDLLGELALEDYPLLVGKRFVVSVGDRRQAHAVEVVSA
jgi:hypothetical protein